MGRPKIGENYHVTVSPRDWEELLEVSDGKRSEVVRDFIAWYLQRPGAQLPVPPASSPS